MTRCYRLVVSALAVVTLAVVSWVATALADAPAGRYTFPASGTVYDTRTLLTWQRVVDPGSYTWSAAGTYCTGLSLAGSGWRLPTKLELESIVDDTRVSPAIDPTAFPSTPSAYFWSSSPYVGSSGYAWFVNFNGGVSFYGDASNTYRVRCVR